MDDKTSEKSTDEIDVGAIFTRIGRSFSRGWMGFIRFLAAMRRIPFENKVLFGSVVIVTLFFGVFYTLTLKKDVYESTMILNCDYLTKKLAESSIKKIHSLAREKDKSGLAKALGISDSVALNVTSFSVETIVDEKDIIDVAVLKDQLNISKNPNNQKIIADVLKRIEIENRHSYKITVTAFKPEVMPELEKGIVYYFMHNPYIKGRVDEKKASMKRQIAQLKSDIRKMDSLKLALNAGFAGTMGREGSNNVFVSDKAINNPGLIYEQSLELYDLLEETQADLNLQKDFEIIDGFTEFNKPASAGLIAMTLYSLLVGWAIAYLIVGVRNFDRYLANLK